MIDFGTFSNLNTSLEMFENSSRQSNRTESIINSCKDGDVILVHSRDMVSNIKSRLLYVGKPNIRIAVCTPSFIGLQNFVGNNVQKIKGDILIDNAWIFLFYQNELSNMNKGLNGLVNSINSRKSYEDDPYKFASWKN